MSCRLLSATRRTPHSIISKSRKIPNFRVFALSSFWPFSGWAPHLGNHSISDSAGGMRIRCASGLSFASWLVFGHFRLLTVPLFLKNYFRCTWGLGGYTRSLQVEVVEVVRNERERDRIEIWEKWGGCCVGCHNGCCRHLSCWYCGFVGSSCVGREWEGGKESCDKWHVPALLKQEILAYSSQLTLAFVICSHDWRLCKRYWHNNSQALPSRFYLDAARLSLKQLKYLLLEDTVLMAPSKWGVLHKC